MTPDLCPHCGIVLDVVHQPRKEPTMDHVQDITNHLAAREIADLKARIHQLEQDLEAAAERVGYWRGEYSRLFAKFVAADGGPIEPQNADLKGGPGMT